MSDLFKKVPGTGDGFLSKIPEALRRLLLVFFAFALLGFLVVKFVIPPEMKDRGLQWKETEKREMAKEIKYAGSRVCSECHEDIYETKVEGYHGNLACETCHGPAYAHSEDPDTVTPVIPTTRDFCPKCHRYDPSRPWKFPQVNPVAHNPLKPCAECHDPHDPRPPMVPKECSACHGEIARTKAVSPHVHLKCITCHRTSRKHRENPRASKPSKPKKRDFCGRCHSLASERKGPPKIDLATHGEKYLCWQCHYPHLPEVHR